MIDDSVYSDGEIDLALFMPLPFNYSGRCILTEFAATFGIQRQINITTSHAAYKAHILNALN